MTLNIENRVEAVDNTRTSEVQAAAEILGPYPNR